MKHYYVSREFLNHLEPELREYIISETVERRLLWSLGLGQTWAYCSPGRSVIVK